ncbi:hypothetical protein [Acidiphilium sp.]|uniref:hypothetical protein n=1 Tax=Acidiphilium sp. TaxID=527 RepID=UPI0025857390|nr:hypothetical protein [Acidiphilium sp.]
MRDLQSNIGVVAAVAPATLTATNTSAAIDLRGFDSACVVINTGAIGGAGNFTPKLTESDTSDGTYTDVAAADLVGEFPSALAAASVYKVGYIGNKRFIQTVLTLNSGTNIAASAVVVLGNPDQAPVA